jgi:hypothetical protein
MFCTAGTPVRLSSENVGCSVPPVLQSDCHQRMLDVLYRRYSSQTMSSENVGCSVPPVLQSDYVVRECWMSYTAGTTVRLCHQRMLDVLYRRYSSQIMSSENVGCSVPPVLQSDCHQRMLDVLYRRYCSQTMSSENVECSVPPVLQSDYVISECWMFCTAGTAARLCHQRMNG